ncbi:MAG: hypothetical protein M3367_04565 [Acidobacteriota bacterium]|nr:hypothetical protein [Acidobacteriota bacterium]
MIRTIVVGILGIVLGVSALSFLTVSSSCDEDVYSKIVPIGGIVTTTETESGKASISRNKTIVFQRMDCKKCLFSVRTDAEGKYEAFLGEGKYQIVVGDCGSNRNKDCIAPNQSRIINAKMKGDPQFDIKLIHSKEDGVVTLPNGIVIPSSVQ